MVAPTFKYNGLKMNPQNEYIVEGICWIKDASPSDIITIAKFSNDLTQIGFIPTMKIEEFEEGVNLYSIAIIDHPVFGPLKISIVGGPDYEIVQSAFDVDLERSIINERATFKQNVHKPHSVRQ